MKHSLVICCLSFFLISCADTKPPVAPIVDGWQQHQEASVYRVQPDDTIYSIAWAFGTDYQDIARNNNLSEPYSLRQGQTLRLSGSSNSNSTSSNKPTVETYAVPSTGNYTYVPPQNAAQAVATGKSPSSSSLAFQNNGKANTSLQAVNKTKQVSPASNTSNTEQNQPSKGTWAWPTQGKLAKGYSSSSGGNRGIDISGKLDQPIIASSSGKVVYTGSSMPGYGKLIIIKHNNNDLSAYAFNNTILVKEGETIKEGQNIATMGKNSEGQAMLHFEVRKNGKPQDPMNYLGAT